MTQIGRNGLCGFWCGIDLILNQGKLVAVIFEWSADAWWIFAARFLCGHKLLQVSVRRDLLDWADNMYFAVD